MQSMREASSQYSFECAPRIYPIFSRPIEFIVTPSNCGTGRSVSVFRMPPTVLHPASRYLCCAWLLRGQKPPVALVYGCCTVTEALDHFTTFQWDLESNRSYSYGASSVSPIQKIFTCASTDAIFHRSIAVGQFKPPLCPLENSFLPRVSY
jgi:hypothetical protein